MRVSQSFREAGFADLGHHLADVARSGTPEVILRRLHMQEPLIVDSSDDDETDSSAPRG
ncbi:hypothetical protein [Massilia phyllosphaerae]|uniref:hypothetical protein n=1 Tax=Massilia phyllosphaerae TaxID=3106034 RepID=UPI002B1CB74F|nr:hypothetical protein [Massilia sp. SGZ-792]